MPLILERQFGDIPPGQVVRCIVAVFVAIGFLTAHVASLRASSLQDDMAVSSKRYIVVDAETGEVFAEQNADEQVAIASLTKMFTTIEALERGDLDQPITTNGSDLFDSNSTLMGFGPGETFPLTDLLYGMMLPSGNDAAHAIARELGSESGLDDEESVSNFVEFINERVVNMGLVDTHFVNPHGWGVDGHYSTARDVATFAMYALKYPMFREIIGTSSYTTSDGRYTVLNTNRLLNSGYSGLIGGKTGYDDDSGYCLIEFAERGDTTLISVTLDGVAPDVWYQDNVVLLDTGFVQKQDRITAGLPLEGQLLSFSDPDAAVISESSISGGSIGAPGSNMSAAISAAPAPEDSASSSGGSVDMSSGDASEPQGRDWRTPGLAIVVTLLVAYGGFRAFFGARESQGTR